jgi:hypothetical protein
MIISKEQWMKIYKEVFKLHKHLIPLKDGVTGEYILIPKTRKGKLFLERLKEIGGERMKTEDKKEIMKVVSGLLDDDMVEREPERLRDLIADALFNKPFEGLSDIEKEKVHKVALKLKETI